MTAPSAPPQAVSPVNWSQFIVRMVIISLLFPVILFLSAGQLDWWIGWVYVILVDSLTLISRYLMIRRYPELMAERTEAWSREDTKSWDRIIIPIITAIGPLSQILIAGLDHRFGWSPPFAPGVVGLGFALMLFGYLFATWAMVTNAYFSSMVRIQTDRGQHVIADGPYRIVRHPAYLGLVVGNTSASLILGSAWSLIPAVVVIVATLVRTALEDRTLQHELPGYPEYSQKTRSRLIPGVW